ncbi:hypothetical protein PR202_gb23421 [Eleusine coracana subsp. coracana]|uniref:lysine--tRNA ligase n=1 Tax=Eleusine coracana subsp. coracana TaxID=191504 RepID=A0AAV5FIT5_ELECO|nr:hypothetical protein PR202_gb23421 [Eleusine coracana subsp. coracana]
MHHVVKIANVLKPFLFSFGIRLDALLHPSLNVEELRGKGYEPYAYKWDRTHTTKELQEEYNYLENGEVCEEAAVSIAGRIVARRAFGKLVFMTVRDDTGTIQLYCEKDSLSEDQFEQLKGFIDIGDILGASGSIKKTEKGELSVYVKQFEILTKSLLPLPDKFHGLTDVDKRYRQRYIDMIANPEVADVFRTRAKVVSEIRKTMESLGFIEVETPVLQFVDSQFYHEPVCEDCQHSLPMASAAKFPQNPYSDMSLRDLIDLLTARLEAKEAANRTAVLAQPVMVVPVAEEKKPECSAELVQTVVQVPKAPISSTSLFLAVPTVPLRKKTQKKKKKATAAPLLPSIHLRRMACLKHCGIRRKCKVGGIEKVYEIGRIFRNEGISTRHNPEFTTIEMYESYSDYESMMIMAEEIVTRCAIATHGKLKIDYQGTEISLERPWRRETMHSLVKEATGIDFNSFGQDVEAAKNAVFETVVESTLIQPTFVLDYPVEISPLAKPHRSHAGLTERFELFICGREIGNAFSELTDPIDQRSRFENQIKQHNAKRATMAKGVKSTEGEGNENDYSYEVALDEDFLTSLEYGMPPASGMV